MTIGLILKQLDVEYQTTVYKGVKEAACRQGCHLVCIQGELFETVQDPMAPPFSTCAFLPLDGLLILSSLIVNNRNTLSDCGFQEVFGNIPIVSVGSLLPGYPHLVVDFDQALSDLVSHLVCQHGYRKLLYLGGPDTNRDNMIREQGLKINVDRLSRNYPELSLEIRNGPLFSEHAGTQLARDYIHSHPERDVDVIVAGSDDLAVGVLKYLSTCVESGWGACPVTGVDDIPHAAMLSQPLTTIRQPLFELGYQSAELLMGLITGKKIPSLSPVRAELVVRGSCGCSCESFTVTPSVVKNFQKEAQLLRDATVLGQELMGVAGWEGITSALDFFLPGAGVRFFRLMIYPPSDKTISDRALLMYQWLPEGDGNRMNLPEELEPGALAETVNRAFRDGVSACSLVHLRSGKERLGLLVYAVDESAEPFMSSCGVFLSHTLKRLQVLEQEAAYTRNLEEQIQSRTRELAEEARRRVAVEAEVLKISDLERMRFSMDLHDDICQRLAGMAMISGNLAGEDPQLMTLSRMLTETLVRTRRYAHESFPMDLESMDFSEAIERLCDSIDTLNGWRCLFAGKKNLPAGLSRKGKINLYRIIQEALHNAVAHSGGSEIVVGIRQVEEQLELTVKDNGVGFTEILPGPKVDHTERRPRGLGLKSMEYRAHQLGGSFQIVSPEEGGALVMVLVPLEGKGGTYGGE